MYSRNISSRLSDAGFLRLQVSYNELTVNFMLDITHRNLPRYTCIRDIFQGISNIHSYNISSSASIKFYAKSSRLYSTELVFYSLTINLLNS